VKSLPTLRNRIGHAAAYLLSCAKQIGERHPPMCICDGWFLERRPHFVIPVGADATDIREDEALIR
jgi:hypothetical protein